MFVSSAGRLCGGLPAASCGWARSSRRYKGAFRRIPNAVSGPRADRAFDLGRIAGELQHYFLEAGGNKHAAEPFIGHFLWEYACHFPDRDRAFRSITGRLPFQMALTLLRIARNSWVSAPQRGRLVDEAKIILRTP
jgi:hypothetical protein